MSRGWLKGARCGRNRSWGAWETERLRLWGDTKTRSSDWKGNWVEGDSGCEERNRDGAISQPEAMLRVHEGARAGRNIFESLGWETRGGK